MVHKMTILNSNKSNAMLKLIKNKMVSSEYVDYQFIQRSIVPTWHYQSALPRLPIPDLNLTCDRYLTAQKPLLIDESYRKTEYNVITFKNTTGKQLQKYLLDFNNKNKHTSYISDMWFDKYLKSRDALPLNSNPAIILTDNNDCKYNDQLIRATNLIISSLRFYKSMQCDLLEPEIYHLNSKKSDTKLYKQICSKLSPKLSYIYSYFNKAYPLDMSQYSSLFSTTRLPETDKDRLVSMNDSKHITVQYNGNIYYFNVLTSTGDIISPNDILSRLKFIINNDKQLIKNDYPIGILTTLERNKWATIRHNLSEQKNENLLKLIDFSLFHVCLENEIVSNDKEKMLKLFLHADGTNRWFDKSFSLIITKDGVAGVNFEHSWGDGVAILRYCQDIIKDSNENPQLHSIDQMTNENCSHFVHQLNFYLDDSLKYVVKEAKLNYKKLCDNLGMDYLIYEGLGKNLCKKNNISPDALMQLAFQIAYHKINNNFVSTYESCSTAAFKHGRTETIRPLTLSVKNFTLINNSASKDKKSINELKQMIKDCSLIHNRLIKEAAMGQGFDRHLFALNIMSERNNIKSNLFDDPEYAHLNYNIISTSTLSSPFIQGGGFGPVVSDGIGIAYSINDDFLGLVATTYKDKRCGKSYLNALKQSFDELKNILK